MTIYCLTFRRESFTHIAVHVAAEFWPKPEAYNLRLGRDVYRITTAVRRWYIYLKSYPPSI